MISNPNPRTLRWRSSQHGYLYLGCGLFIRVSVIFHGYPYIQSWGICCTMGSWIRESMFHFLFRSLSLLGNWCMFYPVLATTTTPSTRVSPPWLQTSQPSVWTTAKLPPSIIKSAPGPQPAAGASASPTTSSPVPTPTSTARQSPTTPPHRSTKAPPKDAKEGEAKEGMGSGKGQSERPPTAGAAPRDPNVAVAKDKNSLDASSVQVPAETPSVPPAISSSTGVLTAHYARNHSKSQKKCVYYKS